IVEQSGGRIDVESELGRGTTFLVYLPASDLAQPWRVEAGTLPSRNGHESILLVEDEATLRQLAARALRARGFKVLLAADGADALRILESHRQPIDLLVT